jgi:hypothetical protein
VGTLYAVLTPRWQAPDEPAHYNYVRSLVEGEGLPVMAPGDYDQDYLGRLTSEGFPPDLPVDSLEYEDHQPPLAYLLLTPVYVLSGGSLTALRLACHLIGGVGVVAVALILWEFDPSRPGLAWLGAGLVAFIPQFVAMMASVNNDALTLTGLWIWLWLGLRYLRGKVSPWVLGGLAGALLLIKTTAYGVLPLALLLIALRARRGGMPWRWTVRQVAAFSIVALALGGLWWGRNILVYGWPDVLGLLQHDEVVVGQPRTADWITVYGLLTFLSAALRTTFQSFWGQFGWMGVVLDVRIYQGLLIFSALAVFGAVWRLIEALRSGLEARQRDALLILGAAGGLTVLMYVGYNLTYVQHQGRYLFPALPIVALASAHGWRRLTEKRLAVGTAIGLLLIAVVVGGVGLLAGDVPMWSTLILAAFSAALLTIGMLPELWHRLAGAGLLAGFVALDLWSLFGFIIPILTGQ